MDKVIGLSIPKSLNILFSAYIFHFLRFIRKLQPKVIRKIDPSTKEIVEV
jgi:hypothetical protein